jgi:hypothetical protein
LIIPISIPLPFCFSFLSLRDGRSLSPASKLIESYKRDWEKLVSSRRRDNSSNSSSSNNSNNINSSGSKRARTESFSSQRSRSPSLSNKRRRSLSRGNRSPDSSDDEDRYDRGRKDKITSAAAVSTSSYEGMTGAQIERLREKEKKSLKYSSLNKRDYHSWIEILKELNLSRSSIKHATGFLFDKIDYAEEVGPAIYLFLSLSYFHSFFLLFIRYCCFLCPFSL